MIARTEKKKVPILMYHSISRHATPQFRPFVVSPESFAEQMAYLHRHGYTPLTVTQLVGAMARGATALPEQPVVLTFDDGFADFYTEALPRLQRYGFPATLYVTTGYVGGTSRWLQREGEAARQMLTWEQLAEIDACGIECGGHTHRHPQLDTLSSAAARGEIVHCKALLEDHLGRRVSSFAYPHGCHSATTKRLVREAGYTSACAVSYAMSSETADPFALVRLIVTADTNEEALAQLLTQPLPSMVATMVRDARAAAWRSVRRVSSLTKPYRRQDWEPAS